MDFNDVSTQCIILFSFISRHLLNIRLSKTLIKIFIGIEPRTEFWYKPPACPSQVAKKHPLSMFIQLVINLCNCISSAPISQSCLQRYHDGITQCPTEVNVHFVYCSSLNYCFPVIWPDLTWYKQFDKKQFDWESKFVKTMMCLKGNNGSRHLSNVVIFLYC